MTRLRSCLVNILLALLVLIALVYLYDLVNDRYAEYQAAEMWRCMLSGRDDCFPKQ